jgi:hypothetical protein
MLKISAPFQISAYHFEAGAASIFSPQPEPHKKDGAKPTSVADPDPGSSAFFPRGSGIRIRDPR